MDSPVWCAPISRAVVFGGTHGNEMAGVCLAKHWMKNPSEIQRQTFTTECCIANPLAVERCVRYIEQDLNRCFSMEILRSPAAPSDSYELKRARDIFHKYGSGDSAVDFALDLHNTTANMGVTYLLCRNNDLFSVHLVNYLQSKSGDLPLPFHCSLTDVPEKDLVYLHRIAKRSLCLEIGPQPHGVIRADILSAMREIVNHVLDFIDLFNQGKEFPGFEMDNYTFFSRVDFPRDSKGEVEAVIHSELQDKDFAPLKPGDPIFKTLDGKDILYEGEKILYPMFINEAAYYEKKVAFVLTEKVRCTFPALTLMH